MIKENRKISFYENIDDYLNDDVSEITIPNMQYEDNGYKIITSLIDKYEVKVKVNIKNEFQEIIEIKVNKKFLDYKQLNSLEYFDDYEKYYKE